MPPPPPIPHRNHQSQTKSTSKLLFLFLKAVIIILLLAFFFLFLAFAAFLILQRCLLRDLLHRLHLENGFASLDVNRLPHFQVAKETKPDDTQCVVCLEGFQSGQWCRKLVTCGHAFHRRCVDAWLVKVAACPSCRTPVRLNAWARGSLVGVESEDDKQLWTCAINDINAFIACKLQFIAFRLCEILFGPWFNAWSTKAIILRNRL